MNEHPVLIERVTILPHPNADALELAQVNDYLCVVAKGAYRTGDLVAYIPEQSVLPDDLIDFLGCRNYLVGAAKNCVRAARLRGVLSQGICLPLSYFGDDAPSEGDDVGERLSIVKHEGEVPAQMSGDVWHAGPLRTLRFDLPNIKAHPRVIEEGEEVVATEKVHGTWTCIGVVSPALAHEEQGRIVVSSKGLSKKGLGLKPSDENLYWRIARGLGVLDLLTEFSDATDGCIFILGETFGRGVQDLHYGEERPAFRVFDVWVGESAQVGRYLNFRELVTIASLLGLDMPTVLYRGPYLREAILAVTDGKETLGDGAHIREGVVVKPVIERTDPHHGRVCFKSVSGDYLTRKNGTEYT